MDSSAYTLTGETKSLEVPVGTEVITKLGVGELHFHGCPPEISLLFCWKKVTDNILKIWIVS